MFNTKSGHLSECHILFYKIHCLLSTLRDLNAMAARRENPSEPNLLITEQEEHMLLSHERNSLFLVSLNSQR